MKISDETIERFFAGACTKNEKQQVARYFEENPSELDIYFPENNWENSPEVRKPISKDVTDKILTRIHRSLFEKSTRRRRNIFYSIGAAAAVVMVIFGLQEYLAKNATGDNPPVLAINPIVNAEITRTNTSNNLQHILLPDSSVVELSPQSTLTYLRNFEPNKRDIRLQGEAVFQVYKDAARPFTVYSLKVATTALGTRFRVKISDKKISVTLYEGKILVRKSDEAKDGLVETGAGLSTLPIHYYLTAGNAITYNVAQNKFSAITSINPKKESAIHIAKSTMSKELPPIVMDNISMASALDELAEKYKVEIAYSPADIRNINIIATVSLKSHITQILHDIVQMNNLHLIQLNDHKFVIEK